MDLLGVKEASEELRVSIHTMRSWIYQRKVPSVHLGRRVFLRREDLEAFVTKNVIPARGDN